jgi:hypothetical protein
VSIFCRGKTIKNEKKSLLITRPGGPVSREELFAYTNGHFLIDERQLVRRYVRFNIDALCDIAAVAGDEPSPIITIGKMEGELPR